MSASSNSIRIYFTYRSSKRVGDEFHAKYLQCVFPILDFLIRFRDTEYVLDQKSPNRSFFLFVEVLDDMPGSLIPSHKYI